jgi:hypothetical protein
MAEAVLSIGAGLDDSSPGRELLAADGGNIYTLGFR